MHDKHKAMVLLGICASCLSAPPPARGDEPPQILVSDTETLPLIQGLAQGVAQSSAIWTAGDEGASYHQISERVWSLRDARLLVIPSPGEDAGRALWTERLRGNGVLIVRLSGPTACPLPYHSAARLQQLHRALVAAFPECRPQADLNLKRELERLAPQPFPTVWARRSAAPAAGPGDAAQLARTPD